MATLQIKITEGVQEASAIKLLDGMGRELDIPRFSIHVDHGNVSVEATAMLPAHLAYQAMGVLEKHRTDELVKCDATFEVSEVVGCDGQGVPPNPPPADAAKAINKMLDKMLVSPPSKLFEDWQQEAWADYLQQFRQQVE